MDNIKNNPMPTDASIITTYRCCMKCRMCDIWRHPTDFSQEITPKELEIIPELKFINITGGEPFMRCDLDEIIEVAFRKAPRVVISTSGYQIDAVFALAEKFPNIGIRVSMEGLSTVNDHLRGRDSGFDRGLRTLLGLRKMGVKDIGFGCTVSNNNSSDMLELFELARNMNMEFATAAYHNSYYFHKENNSIIDKNEVESDFWELIERLLKENSPKSWFRAFFNLGLINYIEGNRRLLPCEAGTVNFFIDPYGDVFPCNGLEDRYWKERMGNIRKAKNFKEIWFSEQANKVRQLVSTCPKNCWMVGTAAPVMKKYIKYPIMWVVKSKLKSLAGKKICRDCIPKPFNVGQNKQQGDLRGTKRIDENINTLEDLQRSDAGRFYLSILEKIDLPGNVIKLKLNRGTLKFNPGQNVSIASHQSYYKSKDYSISSKPDDKSIDFLIRHSVDDLISIMLKSARIGDILDVVGPYGKFTVIEPFSSGKHIFIAIGIAISPFISFVKTWPSLDYMMIHGIRTKKESILAEEFNREKYIPCVSKEAPLENGFSGHVTEYITIQQLNEEAHYYVCGSPQMVKDTTNIISRKGIQLNHIHTDMYY